MSSGLKTSSTARMTVTAFFDNRTDAEEAVRAPTCSGRVARQHPPRSRTRA